MNTAIDPSTPAIAISLDRPAMHDPQTVTVLFGTSPADTHTFAPRCTLRGEDSAVPLFRLGQTELERRLLGLTHAQVMRAVVPERWSMTGSQVCEHVGGAVRAWSPVAVRIIAGLAPDGCVRCALGLTHAHTVHETPPELPHLDDLSYGVLRDGSEDIAEAYRAVHPGEDDGMSPGARRLREHAAQQLWLEASADLRWTVKRQRAQAASPADRTLATQHS